ncbi:MAG: hypothetical protein ACO225_12265, partial [Ilumatobacteraceae bacterium]
MMLTRPIGGSSERSLFTINSTFRTSSLADSACDGVDGRVVSGVVVGAGAGAVSGVVVVSGVG